MLVQLGQIDGESDMNNLSSYIISKSFHVITKKSGNKVIKIGQFTTGLIIFILFLTSCGLLEDGCSEECDGPGLGFIYCPGTREGCRAKKQNMMCNEFSFNENKRACKVSGCPDNCFLSGLFRKEEFETDYSYVEIYKDNE